ncbi:MAG: ATP phosphoribosyltransferase regulatory subunit [Spirochaetes bacterium]|nr:ATP phosphoribosyltransferase regulatory subunit [Spirochaetota bacterium]
MDRRKLLQIPKGTESFQLEEAYLHRKIENSLLELFNLWGYLPIETPVFDFYDIYSRMMNTGTREKVYRLIDRNGDLLMLRSDITLFMAKQIGLILSDDILPLRVCYADTILRYQSNEDISHNEFFQVGAELIGKNGIEADLEIILLLVSSLKLLGISESQIHIGSRNLFGFCFSGFAGEENDSVRKEALQAIRVRDWVELKYLLEKYKPELFCRNLIDLFSFIGTGSELQDLLDGMNSNLKKETKEEIEYLIKIYAYLEKLDTAEQVKIDLSEIGGQDYYTGLSFQVYLKGVDTSIASGGRYNNLFSSFGYSAPAAGFSIMLRKVEQIAETVKRFKPAGSITFLKDEDFLVRCRKADTMRASGRIVCL